MRQQLELPSVAISETGKKRTIGAMEHAYTAALRGIRRFIPMDTTDTGTFTAMSQNGETREVLETTTYAELGGQLQPFTSYRFVGGGVLHQRSESVFACEQTGERWRRV